MPSTPTTTSFALLGLLGIKPWTAYEMVAQIKRGLYFFWPRSEAHLYAELKRLVERRHATAEVIDGPRRPRTRYTITDEGREALGQWFSTEPAAPVVEAEAFLRMFLGDQTDSQRLRETLETTARQARELHARGHALVSDVVENGGPFPYRLHLVEPVVGFLDDFYRMLVRWCEETIDEIDGWPETRDVGLTPEGRERLERILAQPAP
ncbi:PadR family transcriptional regulator [Mycolicibacterium moriokaense]|nr:PadR family transcriptional regulator [Mycolicibacterium moriokaense]